jgi:hypothetical protein
MQTKLTLRLDDQLIDRAKRWASAHGISVSQAVAAFFAQLPQEGAEPDLSAWARSLTGDGTGPARPSLTDEQVRDEYLAHLDEKYR